MASHLSDSEIYTTTSVTWHIKQRSSWHCSSPDFVINNQKCSLLINCSDNHNGYQYQYNLTISLNFASRYTHANLHNPKFAIVLYFANQSKGHIFNLTTNANSNGTSFTLTQDSSYYTIYDSSLSTATCSVTAVVLYKHKVHEMSSTFVTDMKCMLTSEIHSDFQIKAHDKIFNVHKAVIAARSVVLKKMIENNMIEKKLSQLELQADPVVVEALLDFLYTDKSKVTAAPTELFKLAHFLQIDELQMDCKYYLLNNIHLKNIISILDLTSYNDFNLKDLRDAAMKFVRANEDALVVDLDFESFLCDTIKLETITFILNLSYTHGLAGCLKKAMEFIRLNYQKVLTDVDFTKYLKSQPDLYLIILQHCLDFFNTPSDEQKV